MLFLLNDTPEMVHRSTLFEKMELDKLNAFKQIPTLTAKDFIGNVGKQMVNEGVSEGATEIANILSDYLINGDTSSFAMSVDKYEAQGLTHEEALNRAISDSAKNVGLNALGGAISGGVMGAGYQAAGIYNNPGSLNPFEYQKTKNTFAENVDNTNATGYNNIVDNDNVSSINGGSIDGTENSRAGVTGVHQRWSQADIENSSGNESRRTVGGEYSGVSTVFRVTDSVNREKLNARGITDNEFRETSSNPELFSFALEAGKRSNPNGVMVDSHTAEELSETGAKTFLAKDKMSGGAVMPDGNITAVFKHKGSTSKYAGVDIIITALQNGGTKLDCYGKGLLKLYSSLGFEPVAKVKFNTEYAPDGWDYDKFGTPDIYVMKHNGKAVSEVVDDYINDTARIFTAEEIESLPYMEYDAALEYRDSLMTLTQNPYNNPGSLNPLDYQDNTSQKDVTQFKSLNPFEGQNRQTPSSLKGIIDRLNKDNVVDYQEILNTPEISEAEVRARKSVENGQSLQINTPEREAMRVEVENELFNRGSWVDNNGKGDYNGVVESGKQVIFVIGLPASGKSSAAVNPISQYYKARVVDSDDVKTSKTFEKDYDNGYGASYLHEESKKIADNVVRRSIENGDNIVLPLIGGNFTKLVKKISAYKELGYETTLVLNELSSNKALGRAINRFMEDGRYIPLDVLQSYGNKPTETYERIMKGEGNVKPDNYAKISNDVERGSRPYTIDSGGKCKDLFGSRRESGRGVNNHVETTRRGNETQAENIGLNNASNNIVAETEFSQLEAGDTEGIKNAYQSIFKRIRTQYPSTMLEKLTEARRIGMLLNVRTNVRNMVSNALLIPVRWTTDRVSALGQNAIKLVKPLNDTPEMVHRSTRHIRFINNAVIVPTDFILCFCNCIVRCIIQSYIF